METNFTRLSCLPVSFYPDFAAGKMTIADWAGIARDFGLDAVDLSVLMTRQLDAAGMKAARTALRAQNMPVDTVVTYTDFTHPDATAREEEFMQFQVDVKAAAEFGAAYLRITAGQAHPETGRGDGLDWAVSFLHRAADYAARQNIGLLFENHSKPGVWQYFDFAGEPEIYFELIGRLNVFGIDLLFDVANALVYRQDPLMMLENIYQKVRRIHLNDIQHAGALEPVLLGNGVVDFAALFKYLRTKAYQGGLSIEEASFTGGEGFRRAVELVRGFVSVNQPRMNAN